MNKIVKDGLGPLLLVFSPFLILILLYVSAKNIIIFGLLLWLLQLSMCIALPFGVSHYLRKIAISKKIYKLDEIIKNITFVVVAILTTVVIVPGLFQLVNEQIFKFHKPTDEKIISILKPAYSKIFPGSTIKNISSVTPSNKDYIVNFEVCSNSSKGEECIPLKSKINQDDKIVSSEFDSEKALNNLNNKLKQNEF